MSVHDAAIPGVAGVHLRRRPVAILALAAVALAVVAATVFLPYRPVSKMPVPDPNGYDDLIAAARSIVGPPPRFNVQFAQILRPTDGQAVRRLDPLKGNWEEARNYLLDNRAVLARARVGLDRECVVPVFYETGYAFASIKNRDALKSVARLFLWEAQVAVHEGRDADAARSFLDLVRLGNVSSRGGLEMDAWAGLDIEIGALLGLYRLAKDLDPDTCRRAIAALREFDRSREPYGEFEGRQAASQVAEQGRFQTSVFNLLNAGGRKAQMTRFGEAYREAIAMMRLVRIELALQAHRSENGDDPILLDDLVPSTLPEIPLDPFTGRAPIYRKTKDGYQLYSVGPDRVDQNGAPLRRALGATSSGDLLPDSIPTTLIP